MQRTLTKSRSTTIVATTQHGILRPQLPAANTNKQIEIWIQSCFYSYTHLTSRLKRTRISRVHTACVPFGYWTAPVASGQLSCHFGSISTIGFVDTAELVERHENKMSWAHSDKRNSFFVNLNVLLSNSIGRFARFKHCFTSQGHDTFYTFSSIHFNSRISFGKVNRTSTREYTTILHSFYCLLLSKDEAFVCQGGRGSRSASNALRGCRTPSCVQSKFRHRDLNCSICNEECYIRTTFTQNRTPLTYMWVPFVGFTFM